MSNTQHTSGPSKANIDKQDTAKVIAEYAAATTGTASTVGGPT